MIEHYYEENQKFGGHLGKVPIYFNVHTFQLANMGLMNSRHH